MERVVIKMSCCKHCNWRDTDKCELYAISEQLENGEISEDEASYLSQTIYMNCEDRYHDWQLDQGDIRNDR